MNEENKTAMNNEEDVNPAAQPEQAAAPEDAQNPPASDPKKGDQEPKKSFVDRQYEKYCARREKKAEKKANKKELSKAQKTGIGIGAGLFGAALLGGIGKAVISHYANMDSGSDYELDDGDVHYLNEGGGSDAEEAQENLEAGNF